MLFLLLLLPPLVAALLAFVVQPYRSGVGRINALLSLIALAAALALVGPTLAGSDTPTFGPGDLLRADSLSALLLVCVTGVATLTLVLSPGVGRPATYSPGQLRRYQIFINLFIAAMLLAVVANNVGVMWIAIEATTIFSAFIIPLTLTKASVEASWKYILISSVGIALAFAGTVLGYFDFVSLVGESANALNWPVLLAVAHKLNPDVMRLAFAFILVGYGTKAGIAPLHTWKPDAYGEAPAPLSALMSSALFAVAMYAILRWKAVVDGTVGTSYTDGLLLALGLISLGVAAFSLVLSKNYKRLLAYSSLEHTGLICLGLGLGPLGTFAALLHLINHTLAKSLVFFIAGDTEEAYGSSQIEQVHGLLTARPWTGGLWAVGLLALIGLPPFGLFVSEFLIMQAGFALHQPVLMGVTLALLAIAFVSIIRHLNRMLYGEPRLAQPNRAVAAEQWIKFAPLWVNVALLVLLGLTLPGPVQTLLSRSVEIVTK